MSNHARALLVAVVVLASAGCARKETAPAAVAPAPAPVAPAAAAPPVFEETAEAAGLAFRMNFLAGEQGADFKINLYDHGCGVAVADYDGDGNDDVYLVTQLGSNALFRGDGTGKFSDVTAAAGADLGLADRISVSATFADYDNDGRADLFVTTTRAGNVLFRNDGGGKFTDVTKSAGVGLVAHSEAGFFFDADRDGDLDLLVTNTARWTTDAFDPADRYYVGPRSLLDLMVAPIETNVYYRNDGNGVFSDATADSGLAGKGWSGDCAVFDYDEDGAPDVFISNMFGVSQLFHNDGKGRFSDVTRAVLGRVSFGSLGVRAFDYDADGRLDLFAADMHSDMWGPPDYDISGLDERRKYERYYGPLIESGKMTMADERSFADLAGLNYADVVFGNTLFRNLGGGRFEEVSDEAGSETFQPWGVAPADFRNVGLEDVFLTTGMGYPFYYLRNNYLLNRGDGTFAESSKAAGFDPPPGGIHLAETIGGQQATKSSRSAATADFDGDGRVDLVVNNFNERVYLYMNRTPQRNWIEFRLTGTRSNRDAIGALVTIRAGDRTQVRVVQAAGGYLSQSSKTLHFGLGDATNIESCEIAWPSGARQRLEHPAANRLHEVTEPGA